MFYCKIDGLTNLKILDILRSPYNKFCEFKDDAIQLLTEPIKKHVPDQQVDFAKIVKLSNYLFLKKTQICVAGLRKQRASGAAWFLANKWKELLKGGTDNRSFCAAIKVRNFQDESAELVEIIK